jgi:hypothetical protein
MNSMKYQYKFMKDWATIYVRADEVGVDIQRGHGY